MKIIKVGILSLLLLLSLIYDNIGIEFSHIKKDVTIYIVGDSITEGVGNVKSYPSQLENLLKDNGYERYNVVNLGIGGNSSADVKYNLVRITSAMELGDIVILSVGVNDQLKGVQIMDLIRNIEYIVYDLQSRGIIVVLSGITIYGDTVSDIYQSRILGTYGRIAANANAVLIPNLLKGIEHNPVYYFPDMLHPNEKGNKIIAENIFNVLVNSYLIYK